MVGGGMAAASQARAATPAAVAAPAIPPGVPVPQVPHIVETAGHRFGLESADGANSIYLTGRLHFDVGDYTDFHPQSKFAAVQDLNSGVNARWARLGVTGKFTTDWDCSLIYDFGGSTDAAPGATTQSPLSGMLIPTSSSKKSDAGNRR